ncbi:MAG: hypothetical protein K0R61_3046, partial [Microvirga sp.]|nr:hypothetical protein [Microvirga sp.]
MNALATVSGHEVMERVLAVGDLKNLTPEERNTYYNAVCTSCGLNPLTRPFEYLSLNGKLVLYARRDAADQLRKLHNISLRIVEQRSDGDVFIARTQARMPDGREDEDIGAVTIGTLRGEALANARMKAITKSKRRVTLSICGLGFLDETEVSDIPREQRQEWGEAEFAPAHDVSTDEVHEPTRAKPSTKDFWSRENLAIPANGGGWQEWQERMLRGVRAAPDTLALIKFQRDNLATLDRL